MKRLILKNFKEYEIFIIDNFPLWPLYKWFAKAAFSNLSMQWFGARAVMSIIFRKLIIERGRELRDKYSGRFLAHARWQSLRYKICLCNATIQSLILMLFAFLLSRLTSPVMVRRIFHNGTNNGTTEIIAPSKCQIIKYMFGYRKIYLNV